MRTYREKRETREVTWEGNREGAWWKGDRPKLKNYDVPAPCGCFCTPTTSHPGKEAVQSQNARVTCPRQQNRCVAEPPPRMLQPRGEASGFNSGTSQPPCGGGSCMWEVKQQASGKVPLTQATSCLKCFLCT